MKGLYIFLFILSIVTLILVGVANWAFPQGKSYPTGYYEEIFEGGPVREVYEQLPSPLSNPAWVRFFQDNDTALILSSILVSIFSGYMIWGRSLENA
jgi:hypothetical protein